MLLNTKLLSDRVNLSNTGPIVKMRLLVAMIVGVMVALPDVVLHIDVMLIEVVAHVDVSVRILELWVVVEGHRGERIENVGVDRSSLRHVVPLLLFGSLFFGLGIRLVDSDIEAKCSRVYKEVSAPTHATKGT